MIRHTRLMFWGGLALSLALLLMLLRKIDFATLIAALSRLDLRYLSAAVVLTFFSYWLRAVRWRYLLIPERPLPLSSLYAATIIGYMANNLFPARLGEFIRAWSLADREKLPTASVFASLVIDRLCDGFSVMVILVWVMLTLQLPSGMEQVSSMLKIGGVTAFTCYAAVMLLLLALKIRPVRTLKVLAGVLKPFPVAIGEWAIPMAGNFLQGVRISLHPRHLMAVVVGSALIWVFATLPVHLLLKGFGIQLPLTAAFFIMVLLVFAVMIPAAPGYIGTYHLACYTGLAVFGLPDDQSIGIALVVHAVGFFPVILAGLYHVWMQGLSLGAIRSTAANRDQPS